MLVGRAARNFQARSRSLALRSRSRSLSLLASIDQGTSSSRVILYDAATLETVASHQCELQSATTTPKPGWSQMDPMRIVATTEESAATPAVPVGFM